MVKDFRNALDLESFDKFQTNLQVSINQKPSVRMFRILTLTSNLQIFSSRIHSDPPSILDENKLHYIKSTAISPINNFKADHVLRDDWNNQDLITMPTGCSFY